jgi:hypothetical protein
MIRRGRCFAFTASFVIFALASASGVWAQAEGGPVLVWEQVIQADEENQLRWPIAVASRSPDEIAVADVLGSRLLVFRDEGGTQGWTLLRVISLPATPAALADDGRRYLLSLREGAGLFAVEGDQLQLRKVGLPSDVTPGAIAGFATGGFLVADLTAAKVLVLEANGDVRSELPVDRSPSALAASSDGGFFATVVEQAEVRRYGPGGELIATWLVPGEAPVPAWPSGLTLLDGGELMITDQHGHRVVAADGGGSIAGFGSRRGWEPGLLLFPSDVASLGDDRVVVADRGNGRVQIFRRIGVESGQ